MLKITCGTDIIEVNRMQESIERLGDKFVNKIFTPYEVTYCNSKKEMKYQHFAARFAAKESIFKAISELLEDKYEISWTDVEIWQDNKGKPKVRFLIDRQYGIEQIDISLSHLKEYAVATCVIVSE